MRPSGALPPWSLALAALWGLGLWAAVAGLPFFSESYNHLAAGAEVTDWWAAFDPGRAPLRPFQHLTFDLLARWEHPQPGLARLPAFLLHLGSAWLVARLARRLGSGRTGALAAGGLFLLAPNVKNLVWVAAISAPGRVFFVLAALDLLARPREESSAPRGLAGVLCLLAALAFHQSAVVVLGLLPLLACTPAGPGAGPAAIGRARKILARPAVLAALALCLAYAAYVGWLLPERGHNLRDPEALPANLAKALFALAPEDLRVLALEGLRGHLAGDAGMFLAGALSMLVACGAGWLLWRGGAVGRFVVLAVALDAALPVLASGYDQRYAYLGTAFVAAGCGAWVERALHRRAPRLGLAAVLALACAWGWDLARDTLEYRQAGRMVTSLLDQLAEERLRAGPGAAIGLVDLPDVWGRERDLPVFNWGLPQAAARRGIEGPWLLLRTRPFHTGTDSQPASPAELAQLERRLGARLLSFETQRRELVPWHAGAGE